MRLSDALNASAARQVRVAYLSSAQSLLDPASLADLVAQSRRNNAEAGISGMMLYADGNFMQVLEGDAPAIERLLMKVEQDPRHTGIIYLLNEDMEERLFDGWSMCVRRLSDLPAADRQFCIGFVDQALAADPGRAPAWRLVDTFRRNMSR